MYLSEQLFKMIIKKKRKKFARGNNHPKNDIHRAARFGSRGKETSSSHPPLARIVCRHRVDRSLTLTKGFRDSRVIVIRFHEITLDPRHYPVPANPSHRIPLPPLILPRINYLPYPNFRFEIADPRTMDEQLKGALLCAWQLARIETIERRKARERNKAK